MNLILREGACRQKFIRVTELILFKLNPAGSPLIPSSDTIDHKLTAKTEINV